MWGHCCCLKCQIKGSSTFQHFYSSWFSMGGVTTNKILEEDGHLHLRANWFRLLRTTQEPPRHRLAMNWRLLKHQCHCRVLYHYELKACQEKSPYSKINIFRLDLNLQLTTWTKKMNLWSNELFGNNNQRFRGPQYPLWSMVVVKALCSKALLPMKLVHCTK